jgi:predicted nucleotidyltransferase
MREFDSKRKLEKIAQKYSIELFLLFGSQVSKKTHPESDFDIAYLSKKNLSVNEEGKLMIDLAQALKIPLEKIELVPLRGASPFLLKEVFTNSSVLYQKDRLIFDRYKIYALRYFDEFKPFFERMVKNLGKKVKKYKKELTLKSEP